MEGKHEMYIWCHTIAHGTFAGFVPEMYGLTKVWWYSQWVGIKSTVMNSLKNINRVPLCSWICLRDVIYKMRTHMSHFAYVCKMRDPLNLVLENIDYLWFYWTFCIVILDYGLKLHKLSNHTLVMLQKWLEIH